MWGYKMKRLHSERGAAIAEYVLGGAIILLVVMYSIKGLEGYIRTLGKNIAADASVNYPPRISKSKGSLIGSGTIYP